ncbi:MAG TPA: ABC transporter substrate-binding protein/permease [Polyangiaceae bacterium]
MRRLFVLMLLAIATLAARPARADALSDVKARGTLRWGGDLQGGEPYVSQREDGKLVGFEVDIANAIAARLGVRAEFAQNDWSTLVASLERGTFDIILNGFEITSERVGRVLFSRPYYVFAERLTVRKGETRFGASLADLRGRRVGTLAASLAYDTLASAGANIVIYEGQDEPYDDLAHGRTDAVLLDDIIAQRYATRHAELTTAGDLREGVYAIAARRTDGTLIAAIDDALGDMIRSGDLRAILARAGIDDAREEKLETFGHPSGGSRSIAESNGVASERFGAHHVVLFLQGAAVTLVVSTAAMLIAFPLGLLLALARTHGPSGLARAATTYVELYRGTPVLLQLYVLYFGLAPFFKMGPLAAAIVGLGMNYAAYEAETHRAGILAVPVGQMEAARALGMSVPLALRRIVVPQSLRHALPNVTSDFIALLKDSSLVSVITVVELTKRMTITAVDVRSWLLPGALCAGLYLAMSLPLARIARRLENA